MWLSASVLDNAHVEHLCHHRIFYWIMMLWIRYENFSRWVKSALLPGFVYELLSEDSKTRSLYIVFGCFCANMAELSTSNRDQMAH